MKRLIYILLFGLVPLLATSQPVGMQMYPPAASGITYATYDPAHMGTGITLSGGNLTATIAIQSQWTTVISTIGKLSGKWAMQVTFVSTNGTGYWADCGVADASVNLNSYIGSDAHSWGYTGGPSGGLGRKWHSGSGTSYGTAYDVGDVITIAMDLDNGFVYFADNGVWQNSGDPTSGALGTGAAYSLSAGTYYFAVGTASFNGQVYTGNFGASAWSGTIPAGYQGLH